MGLLKAVFITIPSLAIVGTGGFFVGRGVLCKADGTQWKQAITYTSLYKNRNYTMEVTVDSKQTCKIYCCDDIEEQALESAEDGVFYTKLTMETGHIATKYNKDGEAQTLPTTMLSWNPSYGTLKTINEVVSNRSNFTWKFMKGRFEGDLDASADYTVSFDIMKRLSKITYKNSDKKDVTIKFSKYGTTSLDRSFN